MNLALLGFILYLIALIVIGVVSAKSSSTGVGAYFLAGRKLNRWVVALSAVASGRSAWLLIGFVGIAYAKGIPIVPINDNVAKKFIGVKFRKRDEIKAATRQWVKDTYGLTPTEDECDAISFAHYLYHNSNE